MDFQMPQFHRATAAWFETLCSPPTPVQREGWPAISQGGNVLLCAPTGTGKTLASFLVCIDQLMRKADEGRLSQALEVLYVTPIKALGNDIRENLRAPLSGIAKLRQEAGEASPDIRVAIRNGDTTPQERQRMLKTPPHILITTPESLYLLLSSRRGREMLSTVKTLIVDELHAMMDSKRGVHLALSIERLCHLVSRPIQRIGLSATVRPLSRAAAFLGGMDETGAPRPVKIVAPDAKKRTRLSIVSPVPDMRVLPEGTVWPEIFKYVYEVSQSQQSTLVFVNGRAAAEKVSHGVNALAGEESYSRTHHGCISKEQRHTAEKLLKEGKLRLLCATSSMELGIDVGHIGRVVQIGPPPSIASAIQRMGRAGHRPGEESKMDVLPRTPADMLHCAHVARGAEDKAIESLRVPQNCLDILAQHVVSMAATDTWRVEEIYRVARGAWSYRELTMEELTAILGMLAGDYEHQEDKPISPRVLYDRIHGRVSGSPYTRLLAILSGGTIPDRGYYGVYLEDNHTRLGELDEVFVYESRLGDRFMLGAFAWQMVRITKDRVIVRPSQLSGARVPFWNGDDVGMAYETAMAYGAQLREMEEALAVGRLESLLTNRYFLEGGGSADVSRLLREQIDITGCLPSDRRVVVEHFKDEVGNARLAIHTRFGGQVNLGVAMLLEKLCHETLSEDIYVSHDDFGIFVHATALGTIPEGILYQLGDQDVENRLIRLLPGSPLFALVFRHNAARALMMGMRKGGRQPLWIQRVRGVELLDRAAAHPGHPLLLETLRECAGQYLDMGAVTQVLQGILSGQIEVAEVYSEKPSPFTLGMRRDYEGMSMYDEYPSSGAAGKLNLTELGGAQQATIKPEPQALEQASKTDAAAPQNADMLHGRLLTYGDMLAEEMEAPAEWVAQLAAQGRALYMEPGIWLAAEEQALYQAALEREEEEAMLRVARRALRFHGPLDAESLSWRYGWDGEKAEHILKSLEGAGAAVLHQGEYVHAELYKRAVQITRKHRRERIKTVEPHAYAAFLANWQRGQGSPAQQLLQGVQKLFGLALPLAHWEGAVLPARTQGYQGRMLDKMLAEGQAVWRFSPAPRPMLAFYAPEEIDYEADLAHIVGEASLTGDQQAVLKLLYQGGANFAAALAPRLPGILVGDVLKQLLDLGLVSCDSALPLRQMPETTRKQRVRARVLKQDGGRWEMARPPMPLPMEQRILRALGRYGVFSREVAAREEIGWTEALDVLKMMEYTEKVQRGYFVRGMSGAQFVEMSMQKRIVSQLMHPVDSYQVINAADPGQAWGQLLKHDPQRPFMCVPGTAVVLRGGHVALVCERQGAGMTWWDSKEGKAGLEALAHDFRLGKIYPHLLKLTVKTWPKGQEGALIDAGFMREMQDYVLTR